MRHKKLKLSVLLLLVIGLTGLQAQEAVTASGGNASGSGTVSYSVGQVVYTTNTSTISGSVTQGVQQPYEISVVTGLEEIVGTTLICSVYPNPATYFIKLKVENYKTENLAYQLFDISGNLLENKKIEGNETTISMVKLIPAIYFLKVIDYNKEVKIFRIIKN